MPRAPRRSSLVAAFMLLLVTGLARAEPFDVLARDVVLPRGQVEAGLSLEVNLTRRLIGKPWTLAPDVTAGVTDRLTLGITHSTRSLSLVDSGFGLCLDDAAHGCDRAYDDVALDARWALRGGALAVAGRMRLVSRSFDPWKPSVRLGALLRFMHGRFGVIADPQLQLGLVNRDQGNRAWLRVPVWLAVQPACGVLVALRTGLDGEFAMLTETFAVPATLDVLVRVHPRIDASLLVGLPNLLGPLNNPNERHLALTLTVSWP